MKEALNKDIRIMLLDSDIKIKELAQTMGVAQPTLSMQMSKPLTESYRRRIMDAIQTIEMKRMVNS